jgi:hypothetical protein
MLTLTLPTRERRVALQGFWLTIAMMAAGACLAAAWALGTAVFAVAGLVGAVAAAALPHLDEAFAWRLYRAWNARLVRPFCVLLGRLTTRACFLVVGAAGLAGRPSAFAPRSGRASAWHPRGALPPGAYPSLFSAVSDGPPPDGWVESYVAWARQSGHAWAVTLLPFLVVLSALPQGAQGTAQENIYTLF